MRLDKDTIIKIGALGAISFRKGTYFYVGSAMGISGGTTLINRVKRHVSNPSKKKIHWHIDYFLHHENTRIIKIYLIPCHQKIECIIAREISNITNGAILHFGCSDCNCISHLYFINELSDLISLKQIG